MDFFGGGGASLGGAACLEGGEGASLKGGGDFFGGRLLEL